MKTLKAPRRIAAAASAVVLLAGLALPARAQESTSTAPPDRLGGAFLRRAGSDLGTALAAPVHWRGRQLLSFAIVCGVGAALYAGDREIFDWVQARRSASSDRAFRVITEMGNGLYLGGFLTGLYLAGEIGSSPGLRRTALQGVESYLAASAFVLGLKVIAGRARPYADDEPGSFHPFAFRSAWTSFPSGHSAAAFAVAATIAENADSPVVDTLAYGLAGLVAVSRVHQAKHWASDAFIGSAIGYAVGRKIATLNRTSATRLTAFWQAGDGRRAVTVVFSF